MKPENWDELEAADKIDIGNRLFHSSRGRYIMAQALVVAINTMKMVPPPHTETSNIEDMEILAETYFGVFANTIKMANAINREMWG